MKNLLICLGIAVAASLATAVVVSTNLGGHIELKEAIYLHGQDLNARGDKVLAGENCDVLQLVLKVDAGYTDLATAQADTLGGAIAAQTFYPDRLTDASGMFAYSLYQESKVKAVSFLDKSNPKATSKTGTATLFGYCFSNKQDAHVYLQELDKCSRKHADGKVTSIPGCKQESAPVPATPPKTAGK